jgi:hypothetical protein
MDPGLATGRGLLFYFMFALLENEVRGSEAAVGGREGVQHSVLCDNKPEKTGAYSAGAPCAAKYTR